MLFIPKTTIFCICAVLFFPIVAKAQISPFSVNKQTPFEIHLPTENGGRLEINNIDTTLGTRILSAMNATYAKTLPFNKHGISASIIAPGLNQWSGVIGLNDDIHGMDTNLLCEAASITKTFVTALIMRMQDSGKLSIKDSIYKWLPKHYPNVDSAITIEMLLNHSSGIYDYVNDDTNVTVLTDQYETDPSKVWTADEILMNYVHAPNFKPGTNYKYSNTNFVLLGVIAQQVGKTSLRNLLHQNFIDPLKLTHTFVGGLDTIPVLFAHNWSPADNQNPSVDYYEIDKTAQLTGSPGDGNICSTPSDLVRWVHALYLGNVVSPAALKQMLAVHHWKDGSYYGLGTQEAPYYTHTFYGHSGSFIGFKSAMFANPKDSVCVSLYVNWDPNPALQDVYLNDYLIAILNEIYKTAASITEQNQLPNYSVSVYPNPASDITKFVFVLDKESNAVLRLYNEIGMQILSSADQLYQSGANAISIDVSKWNTGIYFYTLQTPSHITNGKLFVK
jgi:D-alanyl-D-alanine carboxypeptidase